MGLAQWFTDETERKTLGATASGAFLDPLCPQSEHAAKFLDLFECMITQDPAYLERLKRHYADLQGSPTTKGGILANAAFREPSETTQAGAAEKTNEAAMSRSPAERPNGPRFGVTCGSDPEFSTLREPSPVKCCMLHPVRDSKLGTQKCILALREPIRPSASFPRSVFTLLPSGGLTYGGTALLISSSNLTSSSPASVTSMATVTTSHDCDLAILSRLIRRDRDGYSASAARADSRDHLRGKRPRANEHPRRESSVRDADAREKAAGDNYERVGHLLDLIHAKARQSLRKRSGA